MEATEVFMATFPTEDGADKAVEQLEAMAKAGSIEIIEAAVISRNADGETSVSQASVPSPKSWAGKGALIGGVVGLIFPPSIIGGALLGAGIGAGGGAIAKHALASDELKEAADELEPGTSAFMAVVDQKWRTELATAMEGYSKLAEHALDADTAANLEVISDEAEGIAAMSGTVMAQDDDAAMVSHVEVVADTETGVTAAQGGTVVAGDDFVAAEGFSAVGVPADAPQVEGGDESDDDSNDEDEDE